MRRLFLIPATADLPSTLIGMPLAPDRFMEPFGALNPRALTSLIVAVMAVSAAGKIEMGQAMVPILLGLVLMVAATWLGFWIKKVPRSVRTDPL